MAQVACRLLQVWLLPERHWSGHHLDGALCAWRSLLLQRVPGQSAQSLQSVRGAAHWHGEDLTTPMASARMLALYLEPPSRSRGHIRYA